MSLKIENVIGFIKKFTMTMKDNHIHAEAVMDMNLTIEQTNQIREKLADIDGNYSGELYLDPKTGIVMKILKWEKDQ